MKSLSLSDLEVGSTVRVTRVRGGRSAVRRFTSLGLRCGSKLTVSQRRGAGVVVLSGNTRVALGPEMARQIDVEAVTD